MNIEVISKEPARGDRRNWGVIFKCQDYGQTSEVPAAIRLGLYSLKIPAIQFCLPLLKIPDQNPEQEEFIIFTGTRYQVI
jgi:hypothetical protein